MAVAAQTGPIAFWHWLRLKPLRRIYPILAAIHGSCAPRARTRRHAGSSLRLLQERLVPLCGSMSAVLSWAPALGDAASAVARRAPFNRRCLLSRRNPKHEAFHLIAIAAFVEPAFELSILRDGSHTRLADHLGHAPIS